MGLPEARKLYCEARCGQMAPFVVGEWVVCLEHIPWAIVQTPGYNPPLRLADGFTIEQTVTTEPQTTRK